MALMTDAAMLLFYDFAGDAADHDDWHTYEHMHERLSVPGFVRGTRWTAEGGSPRYMAIYEMTGVEVGTSAPYLERLNNPTPWTTQTMSGFRGMMRGFCTVVASSGFGLGRAAVAVRFTPASGKEYDALGWLGQQVVPALALKRGIAGATLFRPTVKPPMTKEQSMRGADADMTWVLFATGHDSAALQSAAAELLDASAFEQHSASRPQGALYELGYTITADEAARSAAKPRKAAP